MQRYSELFGKTVKSIPKDARATSHRLLYKGGFIRESTAGRYYFLPLGLKVSKKIINIIKEEMDKAGAQELVTPVLHPLELWEETNRNKEAGFELMVIKDRRGAKFALGGTAEEMMIDLVRKFQLSYKDLPFNIYQFSQKFRDELRARGGLLRVREFMMKDAYSFHTNEDDFKKEYRKMWDTYKTIFDKVGLQTAVVESDNGYIGGEYCHEFVVESPIGESRYLTTPDGIYAAHEDIAVFIKDKKNIDDELRSLEQVEAKRGTTMEDGVKLHKLPIWQQIKDVLFVDENGRFILAIIRGDYDVNETKLKHLSGAIELRHATAEEIRGKIHSEPGFISPVGIKDIMEKGTDLTVVADDSLRTVKNAYGGANKKDRDLLNMNIDRDYKTDIEGDIAMAQEGFLTKDSKKLLEKRGIEVGNIFQLGHHYSNKMKNATFTNENGEQQKYYMGCYGIGVGRTVATIVEKNNDDKGIIWPESVAPYHIHFITLGESHHKQAQKFIEELEKENIEVLWDDREDLSAGEKFADADLIGCPIRLILSDKSLEKGGLEFKKRDSKNSKILSESETMKEVKSAFKVQGS